MIINRRKKQALFLIPICLINIILILYRYSKTNEPKFTDVSNLNSCVTDIVDSENKILGSINIDRKKTLKVIELYGVEVKDFDILQTEFILNPINYNNLFFSLITGKYENYYYCDTGHSVIVITGLDKEHRIYLSNINKKDRRKIYILSEISYEKYSELLISDIRMQISLWADMKNSYYTCFFLQ